jgi:hypothetical protein
MTISNLLLVVLLAQSMLTSHSADDGYDCSLQGVSYLNATRLQDIFTSSVTTVRRYVFLGDSTSRDSFHAFGNLFGYVCANTKQIGNNKEARISQCTIRTKRESKRNKLVISTAEFFPFGRKQGWKRSSSKAYRHGLKGYIAQLTNQDVLIFNMGLHWDETATITATSHDFTSLYSNTLSTQVHDLGLTGYSQKKRCHNLTDLYLPTVLWRETLPQHFNSSNGHYPLHNTSDRGACVPLTAMRQNGNGLTSWPREGHEGKNIICDPSCLPANWQNNLAGALMKDLCVESLSTWWDFSCLHKQHASSYGDCSHLNEVGNYILIGRMLLRIFSMRNIFHTHILTSSLKQSDYTTILS